MNTGMSLGRRRRMPHPWALLKGLTMVEMLVVIGICGVLAMMLVPLTLHSRAKARTVVCANNLQGLGQAFSVCLTESENYFPEAYYVFEGAEGAYQVALRTPDLNQPDALLKSDYSQALSCPSDDEPVEVLGRAPSGAAVNVTSSYGYNVALPLMFLNASRVGHPANTVTFYDGDAAGVVGTWEHSLGWAADTIRPRHQGGANYLFLDGHVEHSEGFPDVAFDGGSRWLASALDTTNPGGAGGWDLGGGDGEEDPVEFTIVDGSVVPAEDCTAIVFCIGSEYWPFGMDRPRVPVQSCYNLNRGSWETVSDDSRNGNQAVVEDVQACDAIAIRARCTEYLRRGPYASNDGSGHCWVFRDGDVVPSISGAMTQAGIEVFLQPYMDGNGCLALGPSDAIFLFEMSDYLDYNRYSAADFQDLVMLVRLSKTGGGGESGGNPAEAPTGSTLGGSININPNNNSTFEFEMILPSGVVITRDDLHSDNPHRHEGEGFHPDYLAYTGPATSVRVKPKGNGNQNGLTVDGQPYALQNKNRYIITSDSMTVHLYNNKRNRKGKAMGKWWIDIDATNATIQIMDDWSQSGGSGNSGNSGSSGFRSSAPSGSANNGFPAD